MQKELLAHHSNAVTPSSTKVATAAKAGLTTGAVALAANLVVFAIATQVAGLELAVTQPGATEPQLIGATTIALMTLAPTAAGTVLLALVGGRGPKAWRTIAWLGLAIGVLTAPMPFTVEAAGGVSASLASMHLVVGVTWLAVLLVTARRSL